MKKPMPRPLYECVKCRNFTIWPAESMYWSELDERWVCVVHAPPKDARGTSLADEIKRQAANEVTE